MLHYCINNLNAVKRMVAGLIELEMDTMIEAVGLTKRYGDHLALDRLDLTVQPGEVYALFGGNGAGKSTTINLFLGFVPPSAGEARVVGIDVAANPVEAKRHVAYVAENVMLYGHATARENLQYFVELSGRRLSKTDAYGALEALGLPTEAFERQVRFLSKGMRQKCGLAIAFAKGASALFLDEPFSGLDPLAATELQQAIAALKANGKAILMSTHDLFRARVLADKVGIMRCGRLVAKLEGESLRVANLEQLYVETMAGKSVPA
jgi:ABC-2 type transport system ATP-binding protein